jgi:hypothetical protein
VGRTWKKVSESKRCLRLLLRENSALGEECGDWRLIWSRDLDLDLETKGPIKMPFPSSLAEHCIRKSSSFSYRLTRPTSPRHRSAPFVDGPKNCFHRRSNDLLSRIHARIRIYALCLVRLNAILETCRGRLRGCHGPRFLLVGKDY